LKQLTIAQRFVEQNTWRPERLSGQGEGVGRVATAHGLNGYRGRPRWPDPPALMARTGGVDDPNTRPWWPHEVACAANLTGDDGSERWGVSQETVAFVPKEGGL
jgi:hypothetical protein